MLKNALKELFQRGDGAHHGISDLYPEKEAALTAALATGQPFDTGWFSSKKEIASGRVSMVGGIVTCEASVSDDFDTEGHGEAEAHPAGLGTVVMFADVVRALDLALDRADENKKENEPYQGYKVVRAGSWVETLILPKGDGVEMETPPGDNYHVWGWQGDTLMPASVQATLYRWAENWLGGKKVGGKRTCDGWTIIPWKD